MPGAGGPVGSPLLEEPDPNKTGKSWELQQLHARFLPSATGCHPRLVLFLLPWVARLSLAKLVKPHFLSCSAQPSVPVPHPQEQLPSATFGIGALGLHRLSP